ncbi:hypothetical protein A2382_03060 [Candidatus Woesebacteria bacterium RIFOXYB1_FULL_38_16]|uniref:Uncharacterized protein n=1 Tax=Candidatus Woesebacteria bacterium RIFOXYB1_FULL_38_16 TaxID=1802538 RepID=A0A1F8CUB6_9BACT|nr:MAG: hypothetical protein A2191_00100 [Candidatus Woesebacteria bacterium RIFOXYA1_FULL_38_9]OGM79429.1 MAG: hypothetical protein A2382_03060 [Candidatus Woesebacteria bacterium RIFOXYB1_FULL_38_16]
MAKKFNLLPKESDNNEEIALSLSILNKINLFSLSFIFIFLIISATLYYYLNQESKNAISQTSELKQKINELQSAEQGLILSKDRIAKIKLVLDNRAVENIFEKQSTIVNNLPDGITFRQTKIDLTTSTIELDATNSKSLLTLFSRLLDNTNYRELIMNKLYFNPFLGYSISLVIN